MFGSTNPFGQSSSSPFGAQSVFGQTNNASNNPFTPKPFGSASPFGSQTGSSIFGGTSTGVFGATQSSSPLTSTPPFGASSMTAFGSSTPAFGSSSTPTFGAASSSFGGSSVFGQKPAFGGFGSNTTQTSPFGSTFQQTQAAFGSNLFGSSTPFSSSSQPAFGVASSSAFGGTSSPAFGSTPTPTFGSTGTAFGVSSSPSFGSSGTQAFGASNNPVFGSSTTSAFGASSASFGSSTGAAFGSSSSPFNFGSSAAFGQSTPAFTSSPFGTSPSPFGAQSSPFGTQTTPPAFGSPGFSQSAFGAQRGGTRVSAYTPTPEVDGGSGTQPAGKLESISAMPVYKDKSHEELRWEDYQQGDKGGPNPAGQPTSGINFSSSTQSNPFSATGTFGQTAQNPFSTSTAANPFGQKTPTFNSSGFGSSSTSAFSSPFGTSSSTLFGTTSAAAPSIFGSSSGPAFGGTSTPSPFGASSTPAFGSTPSIFGSASAPAATATGFGSSLNFGNTQSSPLFQSSTPSLGHTTSTFGSAPAFGQTSTAFGQTNIFSTPSPPFGGGVFSSNTTPQLLNTNNPVNFGQGASSFSTPFQPPTPAQTSGPFPFNSFGQTQPAPSSGFGSLSNAFGQSTFGQPAPSQNNTVTQPTPVTNPFGTLPAMPQISIGRAGSAPSIQYGISSMPVADKPTSVRISSLLTSRHLSQRRIRLPVRKYHPKNDGPKIPFFSGEEETQSTPKADALFIPRENPRALVIRPVEQWPSRTSTEQQFLFRNISTPLHENGKISGEGSAPTLNGSVAQENGRSPAENGLDRSQSTPLQAKPIQKPNGVHNDNSSQKGEDSSSYIPLSGHRAGEAAIVYEHGAGIEALMPKLRHSEYYTEPRIQELAAKERAEPGFCRHVKDFVIGRHGYGSIRFIGETDVRRLDLESLVQFNNREVIVYMDENKKPPVGQGLNKPAEVTLLNIKCLDKKTGEQYTQGSKVERYKEMLMKKARDQGAEFVSYDPIKGEWKFKVDHFSQYQFGDDDDDDEEEEPLGCAG